MTFKKVMIGVLLMAMVVSILGACTSYKVYKRPDGVSPDMAKDKFLIMPIDLHIKGDKLKLSAAVFGGVIAAFGKQGVSLQPVKPVFEKLGLGNLSWKLAHGMYHMVKSHNTYDFAQDAGYHGGNSELTVLVTAVAKLVSAAAKALKFDFKPKWILSAHVDGLGKGKMPKTYKYRAFVGLYNLETKMVEKVSYFTSTCADKPAAILAAMTQLGKKLKKAISK